MTRSASGKECTTSTARKSEASSPSTGRPVRSRSRPIPSHRVPFSRHSRSSSGLIGASCFSRAARKTYVAATEERKMIANANRDIRSALMAADLERSERQQISGPFSYLDEVIGGLEVLHLSGLTVLPSSFMPRLDTVRRLLPPGVEAPGRWQRRIARVIDQCFDLQEGILQAGRRMWHENAVA